MEIKIGRHKLNEDIFWKEPEGGGTKISVRSGRQCVSGCTCHTISGVRSLCSPDKNISYIIRPCD